MMYNIIVDAGIAQLVEQRIRNAQVAGSSPVASSMNDRAVLWLRGVFIYMMRRSTVKKELSYVHMLYTVLRHFKFKYP